MVPASAQQQPQARINARRQRVAWTEACGMQALAAAGWVCNNNALLLLLCPRMPWHGRARGGAGGLGAALPTVNAFTAA